MEEEGGGCLGSGGAKGGISHPLHSGTTTIPSSDTLQLLWSFINQGTSSREGNRITAENGGSGAGSFSWSGFLQSSICSPQSFRILAPHNRPEETERIHQEDQVSDGDCTVGPLINQEERLDGLHRPERCISTNSSSPRKQEVPSICDKRRDFPIQDPMLRPVNSSTGFYKNHGSGLKDSSQYGNPYVEIFGRLADNGIVRGGMPSGEESSNSTVYRVGNSHKYGEVVTNSMSRDNIPGNDPELPNFEGFSYSREKEKFGHINRRISLLRSATSLLLAKNLRPPSLPEPTSSGRKVENEVPSDSLTKTMEFRGPGKANSMESTVSTRSPVVGTESPPVPGMFSPDVTPRPCLLVRRFGPGLGSTSVGSDHLRSVVRRREENVHQYEGAQSCQAGTSGISRASPGQSGSSLHRQHHSSGIFEESRGHSVSQPQPRNTRDSEMVRGEWNSSPPTISIGLTERDSRLLIKTKSNTRIGVDPLPGNSRSDNEKMASNDRSIRNIPQLSTTSLFCTPPRSYECRNRFPASELGESAGLCLPSLSTHQKGIEQSEAVQGVPTDADSSVLASEGVVPRHAGITRGITTSVANAERSTQTTSFSQISSEPPRATASCVATFQRFAKHEGFSSRVAKQLTLARRKSTNVMYQQKWSVFRRWCRGRGVSVSRPTLPKIADFLLDLRNKKKLTVSSIKGYRSMLSFVFRTKLPKISTSTILKELIRSFTMEGKKEVVPPPSWDLNKVLNALMAPPFEPLNEASLRNVTKKALFLLSLASVKRIGEIQALSSKVARQGTDLFLSFLPEFVAKTESESNPIPRHFKVKALSDFAAGLEESRLCPVRALNFYIERTKSIQNRPRNLFLSPKNLKRPITKNAISYFLRETISDADALAEEGGRRPRAHSIRGVGTSISFWRNCSMTKILEAATWKANTVFTSFYLKDVEFILDNCRSLGPFVSAGQIINDDNS